MNNYKVAIIDTGMGNILSVCRALEHLGYSVEVVKKRNKIQADLMILPGVGSFKEAMASLETNGSVELVNDFASRGKGLLGICLGMQLLGSYSAENGKTAGLGLLPNKVERFTSKEVFERKIPHVGFNSLYINEKQGLFKDLPHFSDFYFVHSYRMMIEDLQGRHATCKYGVEFLAAYEIGNICGTQFHPEKSQTNGLILLKNFLKL